jgi:hypothetical protein
MFGECAGITVALRMVGNIYNQFVDVASLYDAIGKANLSSFKQTPVG